MKLAGENVLDRPTFDNDAFEETTEDQPTADQLDQDASAVDGQGGDNVPVEESAAFQGLMAAMQQANVGQAVKKLTTEKEMTDAFQSDI